MVSEKQPELEGGSVRDGSWSQRQKDRNSYHGATTRFSIFRVFSTDARKTSKSSAKAVGVPLDCSIRGMVRCYLGASSRWN